MSGPEEVSHPAWVLKQWLAENGRSQVWLAQTTGVTTKHISMIMNGHALWSLQLAEKISQATGIPAMRLMELKTAYQLDGGRQPAGDG